MRKFFWFLLAAFITGYSSTAQVPGSSLLWEISGNGLQEPSHLFGTCHIICRDDFPFSEILKGKIIASKQFYGEINMDDPNIGTTLLMKWMLSDKTLQSQLSAEDFKKVSEQFQLITGLPIITFNNFKPFYCLSMLALSSISCRNKVQPETEFTNLAKKHKLLLKGLETIDDQMNVIEKEPLDSQISSLKKAVLNFDSVKNVMTQLIAIYKKRDIDSLYNFMKSTGANDDFETAVLDKRNEKWIPVMKKAMLERTSFFAVGVGHLGGQEGLVSLLRKQGYILKPVMY